MIITRTPLRISLVGGGTDQPRFFKQAFGAVVSFAIDKYIYVMLNKKFDGHTRVSYSRTENVRDPMELKHDLVREALISSDVRGVEIASVADIPGSGTGLGSSSAFTVGLVHALYWYTDTCKNSHPNAIADYAYKIERELCRHPVGKQDQYACSYGNLHYYQFEQNGNVIAELINLSDNQLMELENRCVLLWTGRNRDANTILQQQEENMGTGRVQLAVGMRDMAVRLRDELRHGDISHIGEYLHENWMIKRQLAQGITNQWIDDIYERAIAAGAEGGKILGAGGGGFFLFYGKLGLAHELERATKLKAIPFKIDKEGSTVIYEH